MSFIQTQNEWIHINQWHNHIQPCLMQKKAVEAGEVTKRNREQTEQKIPGAAGKMISLHITLRNMPQIYISSSNQVWLGYDQKVQPVTTVSCKKRSFPKFQEAPFHPCCSGTETETLCCCLMSPSCIANMAEVHYWCAEWGAGFMAALGNDQKNGLEQRQHRHKAHWQFVLGESSWLSFQHVDSTHRLQGTLPDMSPQHFPKVD